MALNAPTASASLPTSAESSAYRRKHDVFLSFRAEDTGRGFTSHLYNEFQKREIKTYKDDQKRLDIEEGISPSTLEAIQESRFAIVVLSENYASSTKLLDELAMIFECMEGKDTILPVFYHVAYSDVRFQTKSYEKAFAKHEVRFKDQMERLMKWKDALSKISNISGWTSMGYESERQLVNHIVQFVCSKPESTEDIETTRQAMDLTSPRWKHDVFLNFRGEDTRKGFLSHLYDELQNTGNLKTFKEDEPLAKGRNIYSHILMAIEESRFAIVVLSQNFASCTWRLDELAKICDCMGNQNRILPIFYHVEPSVVRHQKSFFEQAFIMHEERNQQREKVKRWRDALRMVANLSGWTSADYEYEGELIKQVVQSVCRKKVEFTVSTENFESTEHAMNLTTAAAPQLEAAPQPEPSPQLEATPQPEASPQPEPSPRPKRAPLPEPYSKPEPAPQPKRVPQPEQAPQLEPSPQPESSPQHKPAPHPPTAPRLKHDVFLSFMGEDTRRGFVAHLYHELQNTRVIKSFKDDKQLQKGAAISSSLLTAIEESRFAIIVLSENYASSAWCLDELQKIFHCMEGKDAILPIFYKVDPADVRNLKKSFKEAFIKHETYGQDNEKMKRWRAALKGVAGISGWHSKLYLTDIELIKDIVKHLWKKVLQVPTGNFETFEATRQAMDEVMNVLKDDQVPVLGVYGVVGVGKTTMVKHVGAQARKDGLFDHVIMVVVSQSPDLQKIQGTLADSLGLKLEEEETQIGRARRLKDRIMRGNRMLIILDDVWERIELSSIGIPTYDELQRCNSKVILTTRISNVCHSMGCHVQIPLTVLSEEDSWKLFMEMSGKSFHESTNSYDEARKVARECVGLPNEIKAAARSLRDKYLDEWNGAVARAFGDNYLDERNEAVFQPVNPNDETALYHSLGSDDAKSCFLLCCLFPKGYDIPIEELLKYGIGKGLFQYDTMQEARDSAHSVVQYLKASRLFLDGTKKGCIRMHDGIRDVAMSIALSKEGHGFFVKADCELKDWPMDAHEGYSAISLMTNKLDKLPENLVCSVLQILLLQSNAGICDIPETFIQSPNALRVFDLSFTGISLLPTTFSLLTNLQALNLDDCKKILDISVLGKLKKLVILSMRNFPLKKLPREIGELTNLRMLDVTGGRVDTIPSTVISRLYRLEELYMKFVFGNWGNKVEDAVEETNADFEELVRLSYINILKVYISNTACLPKNIYFKPNWVEFDICLVRDVPWDIILSQHDHPSRTLTLDTTINSLPDWFIDAVTEKAKKLEYINCRDLNNILVEYNHGRLHGLKYLFVNGDHKNLKELMNTITWVPSKPVFESLEELHLLHLQCLKELCVGELPPGSLCRLKLLKVQTCRSLDNALLSLKLLQRLRSLEKIICVNMEGMKSVFGLEGLDAENMMLTKLREMRLCVLSELVSIWNGPAPHAIFNNLKIVAVCECKKLKTLFTFNVAECLLQLEDLCVERCPKLDRVIEASSSLNGKIKLSALKKLALIDLPVLTKFCTESGTIEIEYPSLEYLYVEKCPQFPNSASDSNSKNQVRFNDQQHRSSLVKRWEEMHIRL